MQINYVMSSPSFLAPVIGNSQWQMYQTLGCSQVEAGIVEGCSYEEDKNIDQTNCSVVVKSSIGFPEALRSVEVEELEGHYGSDEECGDSDFEGDS